MGMRAALWECEGCRLVRGPGSWSQHSHSHHGPRPSLALAFIRALPATLMEHRCRWNDIDAPSMPLVAAPGRRWLRSGEPQVPGAPPGSRAGKLAVEEPRQ